MKTTAFALFPQTLLAIGVIMCLSQSTETQDTKPVARAARAAGVKLTAERGSPDLTEESRRAMEVAYGKLPLRFEENRGQTDNAVKFLARGNGYSLLLTPTEAVLMLRKPDGSPHGPRRITERPAAGREAAPAPPDVLRMKFIGAKRAVSITGLEALPGRSNYFIGSDPSKWRADIPNYARVRYRQIYPGVDLIYYGNQGQLEWDFRLAPGADFQNIRFAFEGAKKVSVDAAGDLLIGMPAGEVVLKPPAVHQEKGGSTQMIPAGYVLAGKDQVRFQLGPHDAGSPLVIDPVLIYSTFLGGVSIFESGTAIAVDASGSAYVTGYTESVDFPTKNPLPAPNNALQGGQDAFVTKLSPTGNALVYSTYLGGTGGDEGSGIALDSSGSAYVTGSTTSVDFPTKNPLPAPNNALQGRYDAFVAKLSPAGNALIYSTYLGGTGTDQGYGIALDSSGSVYVTGQTGSVDFPLVNPLPAPNNALQGQWDAFVTKLAAAGNALVYSTYLGGTAGFADAGHGIAVDPSGSAYVTGTTLSVDFPVKNPLPAPNNALQGGGDAFVTKLAPAGNALVYSTYLGGTGADESYGIALDSSGSAYVTGYTHSVDFPIKNPLPAPKNAGQQWDAFVTKLAPKGNALVYSTYLGGIGFDAGYGIAVDASGSAYVTGTTTSVDFPLMNPLPAPNNALQGDYDAFVTKLAPKGNALVYSTYLGGTDGELISDYGFGIAVGAYGSTYVTGETGSKDFPTKNPLPAPNNALQGISDAFVAKLSEVSVGKCVSWAGSNLFLCSDRPEIDRCAGQPFGTGCLPLIPRPQVCRLTDCPPCLLVGRWPCPPSELLFDTRGNDLRLNLVTQNGEPAGAIENLKEPLRVGEQTFNQRIRFRAQPGRRYLLEVSMGPRTRMDVGYRLELLLRPDTSKEEPPKPASR